MEITYKEFGSEYLEQIRQLYSSLYTLGAFDGEKLIGFIRCVGDGEHILLVQDLIIARAWRKQRIGSTLFQSVWDKYRRTRMFHVVTDLADEIDNHFYQSFGMQPLAQGHMISYFRPQLPCPGQEGSDAS